MAAPMVEKHHVRLEECTTRAPYRQGRDLLAVKVYTVNQESRYLLVQGVPAVGAHQELVKLFALYGTVQEYRLLDEYPTEDFTEVFWIKFMELQAARMAKKKLDDNSFFGGTLHICYAPEFETVEDTREKLQDRRKAMAARIRKLDAEKQQLEESVGIVPSLSSSFQKEKKSSTKLPPWVAPSRPQTTPKSHEPTPGPSKLPYESVKSDQPPQSYSSDQDQHMYPTLPPPPREPPPWHHIPHGQFSRPPPALNRPPTSFRVPPPHPLGPPLNLTPYNAHRPPVSFQGSSHRHPQQLPSQGSAIHPVNSQPSYPSVYNNRGGDRATQNQASGSTIHPVSFQPSYPSVHNNRGGDQATQNQAPGGHQFTHQPTQLNINQNLGNRSNTEQNNSTSNSEPELKEGDIVKNYKASKKHAKFVPRQVAKRTPLKLPTEEIDIKAKAIGIKNYNTGTGGIKRKSDGVPLKSDPINDELKKNAFTLGNLTGPPLPKEEEKKRKTETGDRSLDKTVAAIRQKVKEFAAIAMLPQLIMKRRKIKKS